MKKLLSLILGTALCLSSATMAFAADGIPEKIIIGDDKNGSSLNELLMPGEEYMFPIRLSISGGDEVELSDEHLEDYAIRISKTGSGNTISTMKLIRSAGVYYLNVEVKDGYPAEETEEEYTLKLTPKNSSTAIDTLVVNFYTGHGVVDDGYVDALGEGDYLTVDNDRPVFTKEQLERISKANNYKAVTFTDRNWYFSVNVTDADNVNLYNDGSVSTALLDKYPSYNLEFITFHGEPTFKTQGTMEVDVIDISELYAQTFYVYRYSGGILTPISASYDHETEVLTFPTKTLGQFVISDKQIPYLVVDNNTNPGTGAVA